MRDLPTQDERAVQSSAQRILESAAQEQEIGNAGQAMLSGALADMAEGKNRAFRLSEFPNKDELPILGYIGRAAPSLLKAMANDKVLALSSQEHAARQIADVLRNPRPTITSPRSMLKKLIGGNP